MIQYLQNTLGMHVEKKPWEKEQALPLYLRSGRSYCVLTIENQECLCIATDAADFQIAAYTKQLQRLSSYWDGFILLCFQSLTTYQRKALIEQRIAFVVPGSQLYFPQMGMILHERNAAPVKQTEKLSPAAQRMFLYFLVNRIEQGEVSKLPQILDISAMTASRAVQELTALGLIQSERSGRKKNFTLEKDRKALFQRAEPYLNDPVRKRVFVSQTPELMSLPKSGLTALSVQTMLNPPGIPCYAIGSKIFKEMELNQIDPAWAMPGTCAELEIWNYDLDILAQDGCVNALSLALSLKCNQDERVQQAVEEMMEEYQW